MFDSVDYPQPLDERLFDTWLENGRESKMGYVYLLVVWDEFEMKYAPVYAEHREEIESYQMYGQSTRRESLIAAYDLYSHSKIV